MPNINTGTGGGSGGIFVPTSRRVNTTSPLAGGGSLAGDLTISIDTTGIGGDVYLAATQTFTGANTFTGTTTLGETSVTGGLSKTTGAASDQIVLGSVASRAQYILGSTNFPFTGYQTVLIGSGWHQGAQTFDPRWSGESLSVTMPSRMSDVQVSGNLRVYGYVFASGVSSPSVELLMQQTGDTFGPTSLSLRNRVGMAGALFEQRGSVDLIDFGFKTLSAQRLIRVESRAGSAFLSAPEFEFGDIAASAEPNFVMADTSALFRRGPVYNTAVSAGQRYITSGEIPTGVGTGDFVKGQDNFVTGGRQVFGPATAVSISGNLVSQDTQISGTVRAYGRSGDLVTIGNAATETYQQFVGRSQGQGIYQLVGSGLITGSLTIQRFEPHDQVFFTTIPLLYDTTSPATHRGTVTVSGMLRSYRGIIVEPGGLQTSGAIHAYGNRADRLFFGSQAGAHYQAFFGDDQTVGGYSYLFLGSGQLQGRTLFTTHTVGDIVEVDSLLPLLIRDGGTQISGALKTYGRRADAVHIGDPTSGQFVFFAGSSNASAGRSYSLVGSGLVLGAPHFAANQPGDAIISEIPIYANGVAGASRYVTSGDLGFIPVTAAFLKNTDNYVPANTHVFGNTSVISSSGQIFITRNELLGTFFHAAGFGSTGWHMAITGSGVVQGHLRVETSVGLADRALFSVSAVNSNVRIESPVQISGTTLHYAPLFFRSTAGENRYLTSGELTGTGDFVKAQPNYVTGSPIVFGGANVNVSGLLQIGALGDRNSAFFWANNTYLGNSYIIAGSGSLLGTVVIGIRDPRDTASFELPVIHTTGVQISGVGLAYAGLYGQRITGAGRYLTSGELKPGDFVKGEDNFVTGSKQVFGPATTVSVSGSLIANAVQVTGRGVIVGGYSLAVSASGLNQGAVSFQPRWTPETAIFGMPIYQGVEHDAVTGASRYVTSGELQAGVGTGDATRGSPNYFSALNVFGAEIAASGLMVTRNLAVSGALMGYQTAQFQTGVEVYAVVPSGVTPAGGQIHFGAQGNTLFELYSAYTVSNPARIKLYHNRNSLTVPTNTNSADTVGSLDFMGYAGGTSHRRQAASITVEAEDNWWSNSLGGALSFTTTTSGTLAITERVRIGSTLFRTRVANSLGGATQISGLALAYGPIFHRTESGPTRYLTSGELSSIGTGDFVKNAANYVTGSPIVFGRTTDVGVSGTLQIGTTLEANQLFRGDRGDVSGITYEMYGSGIIGGYLAIGASTVGVKGKLKLDEAEFFALDTVLISGTTRTYAPIYGNNASDTGANRYQVSGEYGALPRVVLRRTIPSGVFNTTGETIVMSGYLPGGLMGPDSALRLGAHGYIRNDSGLTRTYGMIVRYGGTMLWSGVQTKGSVAGQTSFPWKFDFIVNNANATNRQRTSGVWHASTTTQVSGMGTSSNAETDTTAGFEYYDVGIDTTAPQLFSVAVKSSDAAADVGVQFTAGYLELLP